MSLENRAAWKLWETSLFYSYSRFYREKESFESPHQLLTDPRGKKFQEWQIFTVDLARIPKDLLGCKKFSNVHHLQQSASRILAPNGTALFNFHYPSWIYERVLHGWKKRFWQFLLENERIFSEEEQVREELAKYGLKVERVQQKQSWQAYVDDYLTYWEVDAIRF